MKFRDLVPPLELCKKIPAGEFKDSAFNWFSNNYFGGWNVERRQMTYFFTDNGELYPAPTLQEILEELHKLQEDVFLKWSETAYNEWLVDAYTHNVNNHQAHDKNPATAALKVWLELKGIKNEHRKI